MSNQQLYFAIGVPVFTILVGMMMNVVIIVWQAKGVEKRIDAIDRRLDRIESRLTVIEQDYKLFFQDIARIKAKVGL